MRSFAAKEFTGCLHKSIKLGMSIIRTDLTLILSLTLGNSTNACPYSQFRQEYNNILVETRNMALRSDSAVLPSSPPHTHPRLPLPVHRSCLSSPMQFESKQTGMRIKKMQANSSQGPGNEYTKKKTALLAASTVACCPYCRGIFAVDNQAR